MVWNWVLCVLLPAGSILLAVLAQVSLQRLWPMTQHYGVWGITAESYFAVAVLAFLSFLSGYWVRKRMRAPAGLAVSSAVPFIWLGALVWASRPLGNIFLTWAAVFGLVAAVAPLAGVTAGWLVSSAMGEHVESA